MTPQTLASLAMGSMLFRTAHQATLTSSTAHSTGAMAGAVSRAGVLPFDMLAAGTTCETITPAEFPHPVCTTVLNVSAKIKQVTVVITPTSALHHPETTVFRRTISGNGNPLKIT